MYSRPAVIDRVRQLLRTLCLMAIVFTGASAYAEWVPVEKDYLDPGLRSIYIDPDTISREGPFVAVWQLTDYRMMQGGVGFGRFMMSPHRFFSAKTQKQLNCARKQIRLLAYTEFLSHMGTGMASHGYVDQDAWLPIEPASVNHALWEVLCGQRWLRLVGQYRPILKWRLADS
ncbi:MAG: hypothetical protein FJ247_11340 [Nitrospira sp.]|nr:hypothetical protein [Nitrospira sp.]